MDNFYCRVCFSNNIKIKFKHYGFGQKMIIGKVFYVLIAVRFLNLKNKNNEISLRYSE